MMRKISVFLLAGFILFTTGCAPDSAIHSSSVSTNAQFKPQPDHPANLGVLDIHQFITQMSQLRPDFPLDEFARIMGNSEPYEAREQSSEAAIYTYENGLKLHFAYDGRESTMPIDDVFGPFLSFSDSQNTYGIRLGVPQDIFVTSKKEAKIETSSKQQGYLGEFEIKRFITQMSQVKRGMTKASWINIFDNVEPQILKNGDDLICEYAYADNMVLRLKGEKLSAAALYSNEGHIAFNINPH